MDSERLLLEHFGSHVYVSNDQVRDLDPDLEVKAPAEAREVWFRSGFLDSPTALERVSEGELFP